MPLGGVFTATQGLKTTWNAPLDERGIIGTAVGIAMTGDRCVAEIQFCDYIFNTIDLLKIAGNTHWVSNGNYHLPLTVMTPVGAGIFGSVYHSHSFDAWATRLPGWRS
jgi:2-oxoisovalerate dehydrogenase E1 component beta subunit